MGHWDGSKVVPSKVPLKKGSWTPPVKSCNKCDEKPVGKTQHCERHMNELIDAGWKFSTGGNMKRGEVTVSTAGRVTVSVGYNARMLAVMSGELAITELDSEELARGMCRNENGQFPRKEAELVPKAMYDQMTRELFARVDMSMRAGLEDAVQNLVQMTADPEIDAGTRLRAGQWLFERLRGKVPDVIQFQQEKPFEQVLTHIHRGPRTQPVDMPNESYSTPTDGSVDEHPAPEDGVQKAPDQSATEPAFSSRPVDSPPLRAKTTRTKKAPLGSKTRRKADPRSPI